MRIVSGLLLLTLAGSVSMLAQNSDPAKVAAYAKTLPAVTPPVFDKMRMETLAAYGISCTDHPQEDTGTHDNYLWGYAKMPVLLPGYDKKRAFFGCSNWHDAVGTIWMMMSLMNQDPKLLVGTDIKDIETTHFGKSNMDGEYGFFTRPQAIGELARGHFEEPYGYSWLLKLYGETKASNSAGDKKVATALAPLARWMSERYVFYLYNLKYPLRVGTDANTAWAMSLTLDGVNLSEDTTLKTAVQANAIRLFGKDKDCPTGMEPQNSDDISSCLTEAALMGRVMDQPAYLKWLDAFLPPVYSNLFEGYTKPIDTSHTNTTGVDAQVQLRYKANLIALSFQRATELLTIAYALPKDDARVPIFRTLAAMNARHGYDEIGSAGYEGQHFLATYALLYENEVKGPAPLAPEKSKDHSGSNNAAAAAE